MTMQQWVDAILRLIGYVTSWPVVTLSVVIILRKRIIATLSALAERARKASLGPVSVEFDEVAVEAFQDTARQAAHEFGGDPARLADFLGEQLSKFGEQSSGPRGEVFTGRRILWVDDNIRHNLFEMNYLERLGVEVEAVTTTEEALRSLGTDDFHLIITDMHRVEGGVERPHAGLELLRKIGSRYRNALVLYTSNASLWRNNAELAKCGAVATDTASDLFSEVKKIMRNRVSERTLRRLVPGQRQTPGNGRPRPNTPDD